MALLLLINVPCIGQSASMNKRLKCSCLFLHLAPMITYKNGGLTPEFNISSTYCKILWFYFSKKKYNAQVRSSLCEETDAEEDQQRVRHGRYFHRFLQQGPNLREHAKLQVGLSFRPVTPIRAAPLCLTTTCCFFYLRFPFFILLVALIFS